MNTALRASARRLSTDSNGSSAGASGNRGRVSTGSATGMTGSARRQNSLTRIPMAASRVSPSHLLARARRAGFVDARQGRLTRSSTQTAANRLANTQPTYDFLSGASGGGEDGGAEQPGSTLRQSARRGSIVKPAAAAIDAKDTEDLRARLKTLQYEVDAFKQEKEMTRLRHEKELRDARARAEADFKRAQVRILPTYISLY